MSHPETTGTRHTRTTDELLAEIGGRIERLDTGPQEGLKRGRIAVLRRDEAYTRGAIREGAVCVEHGVRNLDARVEIAERSVAADLAQGSGAFLDAVMREMQAWDLYLERRQLGAAMTAGLDRDRVEAAISELRRCTNAVRERVAEVRSPRGAAPHRGRRRVQVARDDLERRAAAFGATWTDWEAFDGTGRVD